MDPDEYLWSKLPGRCCFDVKEICPFEKAPRSTCKHVPPDTCRDCGTWSTPENYCHGSRENCESCGMKLYCASPPPLLDGNKVCTGSSRVGTGCYDDMGTGMCANKLEADCEDACRANPKCELFVYYPHERKGTCVLCSDLFSSERTPDAATRAYAVGARLEPPAPPGMETAVAKHFSVVPEPSPPSPPVIAPPPKVSHLGRHKSDRSKAHVDCQFFEGVELTTSRQSGYSDRSASTKEECCNLCGHLESGCANFIYEPSTGVCVLLPLTPASELERDDNEYVISGQASVGAVASNAAAFPTSSCAFIPDSGYSGPSNGPAPRLPGGEMQTREECCQACGVTPICARFTFSDVTKECIMYPAYAEIVMVNELTSGSIPSKLTGATAALPKVGPGGGGGGAASGSYLPVLTDDMVPPSPSMPSFAKLIMSPPPPPPDKEGDASELFKGMMSDLSIIAGSAMLFGFLFCMYCFFAPQLMGMMQRVNDHKSKGKYMRAERAPRRGSRTEIGSDDEDDDDDDDGESLIGRRKKSSRTALVPIEPRRKSKRSNDRGGGSSKNGRERSRSRSRVPSDDDDDDQDDDDDVSDDDNDRGRGRGRRSRAAPPKPTARLMVQTTAISQSRNIVVTHCRDYEALRSLFFEEFYSALKGIRPSHTLLFCLAPPPGEPTARQRRRGRHEDPEEQLMWLLVSKHSDFEKVIACPAFRLQDQRCDEDADPDEYVVAFEKEKSKRQRQRKQEEDRRKPLMLEMVPVAVESPSDRDGGRSSRRSSRRASPLRNSRRASPLRKSSSRPSSRTASPERGGRRSRRSSRDRTPSPPRDSSPVRERSRERSREQLRQPRARSRDSTRNEHRSSRRGGGSGSDRSDDDGGGSSSGGESTASSRQLLRGNNAHGKSSFVPLSSSALEQLPAGRSPSRAHTPSVVSHWDDDDPDGTGRSSKLRGTAIGKAAGDLE